MNAYQIFANICEPNVLPTNSLKNWLEIIATKLYLLIKSNKNVQWTSYKYFVITHMYL
jgi:hypothetical protein